MTAANTAGSSVARKRRRTRPATKLTIAAGLVIAIFVGVLWYIHQDTLMDRHADTAAEGASPVGRYAYQVGKPGPGEVAPPIRLSTTRGTTFDLASYRGKTVLIYFQEGITCQPCWDQLKDIEKDFKVFREAGIEMLVSITTDPADLLKEKVGYERLFMPVLSDASLAVSRAYAANSYGMMGQDRDGHSFVVVGPDGRIEWRADYGGAPQYTMYLPVQNLVADIKQGLAAAPK